MEDRTPEAPAVIWDRLSKDGQKLALSLAVGRGLSQARWFLEAMAQDPEMGFDLDKSMKELSDLGILQQVILIEERRELLARMRKPRDIVLMPLDQVPLGKLQEKLETKLTENEREYLRRLDEIEEYEANKDRYPDRYKGWEEPRFRLTPDFQTLIDTLPEE